MELNPILCFQHCEVGGARIYCLALPEVCPQCGMGLTSCQLTIPPFRLPTPFVNSTESSYSVVLRPTSGNFLEYVRHFKLFYYLYKKKGKGAQI